MWEDQIFRREGFVADGGSVDVSLETSHAGSRDANMESDVFRRGRWRKPLSELLDLHPDVLFSKRIMSTRLWISKSGEEVDNYQVVDRPLTAVIILRIMDPCEVSTSVNLFGVSTTIYPYMDTRRIDVILCLRQHDISALLMTLFWKSNNKLGARPIKQQRIYVVIFGEHRHLADHLLDGTNDSQVVDRGVIIVSYEDLILARCLLRLWGVMAIYSVDFILSRRLLQWAQHGRYFNQLVTKIHVAWGDFLQSAYALLKRMKTFATSTASLDVFQDESSVVLTHKSQKIDRRMILAHSCHNSVHMYNKILFITVTRSVLKLLVGYYPSHIQGHQFIGIDSICPYHSYKSRGMEYYLSTALRLLRCHKMIREYFPMKMRCFINLELLLSCEMNGKQGNFEMNGEQIPSIGYLSEMMRRYRYPVGEYLHDLSSPLSGYSLQDFASQFYSGYGLQGFASQFSTHGSRHIADGFYIVVGCKLHLHHPSFVEITQEHRQHHILTPEEYGETSTTRLCHVIRPSKDTSLCRSYILLGIATAEDTFLAQFGDVKSTAILRYQDGYGTLLLSGKDSIWVSISGDTCALSIARYALWIDGDPDIYALRDQVSSDLLSCGHHRVDFEYGERCKCVAIQELFDASHNFARCQQTNAGFSLRSGAIFRCNLFDGLSINNFFVGIGSAAQEILFVRTPDGYAQFQLHDQLQHQVADERIYLEVRVTNDRPFANKHKAISSTFSIADLRLPYSKEEELLIQYTTPTGQINDYQELMEEPSVVETASCNNKFPAQVYYEIINYLLKWGAWNKISDWLRNVKLLQKAYECFSNCASISSVVNYHKIWKGLESERKMGRVDLGIGKKDGEKGFRNWEENWGEILFGELMTTAQVGECQIMYFVRCLSIIIHGNEMF